MQVNLPRLRVFLTAFLLDILLICPTVHRPSIYHHIHSDSSSIASSLRIDLQTYDETQDTAVGTCIILRSFADRITKDFIVLPCDFFPPPSLPLNKILNKYRADNACRGSLATICWISTQIPDKTSTFEEWGYPPCPPQIIWDGAKRVVVRIETPNKVDCNPQELDMSLSLLNK